MSGWWLDGKGGLEVWGFLLDAGIWYGGFVVTGYHSGLDR